MVGRKPPWPGGDGRVEAGRQSARIRREMLNLDVKFDHYPPTERLKAHVKSIVVSENPSEKEYKVLPSSGLVVGFQYKGKLSAITDGKETELASSGITGVSDTYKLFKNPANTGTVLVYFTETGFTHFASHPAHLLFNLSLSLDDVFDRQSVQEVEEKLAAVNTDGQRVRIVEQFLLAQLKDIQADRLVVEAVKLIYQSKGTIRIRELHEKLLISQSPFEKRFRRVVGTTPKKFASIIRFNAVLDLLDETRSLTDICYENNFFDQAHFSKNFKQFTGDTPENFKRRG